MHQLSGHKGHRPERHHDTVSRVRGIARTGKSGHCLRPRLFAEHSRHWIMCDSDTAPALVRNQAASATCSEPGGAGRLRVLVQGHSAAGCERTFLGSSLRSWAAARCSSRDAWMRCEQRQGSVTRCVRAISASCASPLPLSSCVPPCALDLVRRCRHC